MASGYYSNGYGRYYGSSGLPDGMEGLLVFYVVFMFLALAVAVAGYLFKGFGMYGMAKKMNVKYPWLAFIPIASNYLQGELAGDVKVGKKTIKNTGLWTLLTPIIVGVLAFVVTFVFIFTTVFSTAMRVAQSSGYSNEFPFGAGFFFSIAIMSLLLVALSTAEYLVFGVARYHIHKKYTDDSCAVGHMLLGLFIPLYQSIYFFVLRNRYPQGTENPYDSQIVGGGSDVYRANSVQQAAVGSQAPQADAVQESAEPAQMPTEAQAPADSEPSQQ